MLEFETFVYLDLQKTGSTFICHLLRTYSIEKEISFSRHDGVGSQFHPEKFHFISIRNPLDQYLSLYAYGCRGKGSLFARLQKRGQGHLYDSSWSAFERWLEFVLDSENAILLDGQYGRLSALPGLVGFQTYRFLELAILNPATCLNACRTEDDVRRIFASESLIKFVIRHERFDADMEELLRGPIRGAISDLEGALVFLASGRKMNASRGERICPDNGSPSRIGRLLQSREWLLQELFGY